MGAPPLELTLAARPQPGYSRQSARSADKHPYIYSSRLALACVCSVLCSVVVTLLSSTWTHQHHCTACFAVDSLTPRGSFPVQRDGAIALIIFAPCLLAAMPAPHLASPIAPTLPAARAHLAPMAIFQVIRIHLISPTWQIASLIPSMWAARRG